MKILIVCSANSGKIVPFIQEQVIALEALGLETDYFLVKHKGLLGYLGERKKLIDKIKAFQPNLIHAHYGLSGLLANLQRKVPVITTYHGSDINETRVFLFSRLSIVLSTQNIFVSEKNRDKSGHKKNQSLIPCGVDIELFTPMDKNEARDCLGLVYDKKYVLFAGAFDNEVKNSTLAKAAVALIPEVELLELKGYTREQVVLLMNAVDAVLMTSFTEGSPQFIKEAMACNCPIVSVPVGDVQEVTANVQGCYICSYNTSDVVDKLRKALLYGKSKDGRYRIVELGLDSETISKRILSLYKDIIKF